MRVPPPILATRICDLGLRFEDSAFPALVAALERELGATGIALRPRFYLSTEYGCIAGSATVGLLWTDGFPFGTRLARRHGLRTRGPRKMLRTLRHETGHAFCYVHRLYRTRRFRDLFGVRGSFFGSYPDRWRPRASDRRRLARGEVLALYATRHPDEDFAICFQTWLLHAARGRDWRRPFRDRPVVLSKLEYVADVVRDRGGRRVAVARPPLDEPVDETQRTVAQWLASVRRGENPTMLARSPVA